jgi:hypothetical protein
MIIVTNTMKTDQKSRAKPGPKGIERVMVTFRFPAEIARKLRIAAAQETLSQADVVQLALRDWFRKKRIE